MIETQTDSALASLAWPAASLPDALTALLQHARLPQIQLELSYPPGADPADWIESAASQLGSEAFPADLSARDLPSQLAQTYPALLRVSDELFLVITHHRRGNLTVIAPGRVARTISATRLSEILLAPHEHAVRATYEELLDGVEIPRARWNRVVTLLSSEQLGARPLYRAWIFRPKPGAHPGSWLRETSALKNGLALITAHTAQYLLWIASWIALGRLSLAGHAASAWLLAWALLLFTMIPFRLLSTWKQGLLAIGVAGYLKRRLLWGALRLNPEEIRRSGAGTFLAQAFEAEAVETLALSGAIAGVLALIELAIAAFILGPLALLLIAWCALTALFAWRFLRRYQAWTTHRLDITQDLVESMVGNRTRLAQLPARNWHRSEDRALDAYLRTSRSLDRASVALIAGMPRGWLLAALACFAASLLSGPAPQLRSAAMLGGILLAFAALSRLTGSLADIAAASIAWKRIAPLFNAAARPERLGELLSSTVSAPNRGPILEAERLTFRYRREGNPALQGCSLTIRNGDRVLLEGPSGGGKTTLASLLAGLREPESGLLLIGGLDRHTLGDARWRKRIAAAPQFHENHILTETLAFNLLMGRRWPPSASDLDEAESICRELGLGNLLDTMPSGILQMVGEGGWQLSHGERSRVFIARALLQGADLIILDESFAALDPGNLCNALDCTLRHTPALLVIAHP